MSNATEQLAIPVKDGQPIVLHVPAHLKRAFRSRKQRQGVVYCHWRMTYSKPDWRLNPVELSSVLGISRWGAHKVLMTMAKRGLVQDCGNKRIDTPARLMAYGLAYRNVHEYQANIPALNALFYNKAENESCSTILKEYYTGSNTDPEPPTYNKSLPQTFYNLTPEDKVLAYHQWCEEKDYGLIEAFLSYIQSLRDKQPSIDLPEPEPEPDPELEALKEVYGTRREEKSGASISV